MTSTCRGRIGFRVAVAAGVALAVPPMLVAVPATATAPVTEARCGDAEVTVVVDPGSLGGEAAATCASGASAAAATEAAGFALTFVQGAPFVCRVAGRPSPEQESCGRTPPADAYWGLFWSETPAGPWSYATVGAAALEVPAGGMVGWRWQDGGSREVPTVGTLAAASTGSAGGSADGSAGGAGDGAGAGGDRDEPRSDQADAGVPGWAAAAVVVLLGGAVGAVGLSRRRGRA